MVSSVKLSQLSQNHPLAKAKLFYFFYEAIAKSLPAHLAAYYKHSLLLSPHQVSVLVAARYFAVLFGSPVLGLIADKLNTFRNILIVTLIALLVTYLVVPIIEPIDGFNCLDHLLPLNVTSNSTVQRYNTNKMEYPIQASQIDPIRGHFHSRLMYGFFYSWPFETWAYEETDDITRKVFITLLLVTLLGEFFASPSETFLDLYTLQVLGNERDKLGWQLTPGILGWLIVSLIFLSLRVRKPDDGDFCFKGQVIASTPYLFVIYGLICVCIIIAMTFQYNTAEKSTGKTNFSCDGIKRSKCFKAFQLLLEKPAYAAFAVAVIFSGFSAGTKTLFIYSYVQDLGGGSVIIIAIICVNAASNMIALALSPYLLRKYGHENLIAAGLFLNGITFVTYSVIEDPWLVMLVEPFDGICLSLPWVAALTYAGCPPYIGAALQGLIHGLYRGLGIAIGYFVVSVFILRYGYLALFVGLGLTYFVVFGGFVCIVNVYPSDSIAEGYTQYTMLFNSCESFIEAQAATVESGDYENAVLDTSFLKDTDNNSNLQDNNGKM